MKKSLLLLCFIQNMQAMERILTVETRNAIQAEFDWCNFLTDLSMSGRIERGPVCVSNTQAFGCKKVKASSELSGKKSYYFPFGMYMCNHYNLAEGHCVFANRDNRVVLHHRAWTHGIKGANRCSFPYCTSLTFATAPEFQKHNRLHSNRLMRYSKKYA